MSDLSPEARALFEAGRRSLKPTTDDRERLLAAISGQIPGLGGQNGAPDAQSGVGHAAVARAAATGLGWRGVAALAVGLGVTSAVVVGIRHHESPRAAAPSSQAQPNTPAIPATPPAPALAVAPAASDAPASEALAPSSAVKHGSATGPSDRLSEEVRILSDAERDLHAGRYQSALRLLDEHQRKFPHGTLAQERVAARVQALCGLGRVKEAERALGRLSPNSPHEGTAKAACAIKSN